ncbi:MAG TPA: hypothetical protein VEH50_12225 [Methylomirabilota bacterium]|nr:hypothetical protein [Methylomirabilota bacterium]
MRNESTPRFAWLWKILAYFLGFALLATIAWVYLGSPSDSEEWHRVISWLLRGLADFPDVAAWVIIGFVIGSLWAFEHEKHRRFEWQTSARRIFEPVTRSDSRISYPLAPGVKGWAREANGEILIGEIAAEQEAADDLDRFLACLSPRCVIVGVSSGKLGSILCVCGWKQTWRDGKPINEWRRR